jgi:hypothetical protein
MATRRLFDGATIEIGQVPIVGSAPSTSSIFYIKVAGIWKQAIAWVKVSGVWKQAIAYVKASGAWKNV